MRMVRQLGAKAPFITIWSLILMSLIVTFLDNAVAQEWEEQYDPNTEVAIRGKIAEIIIRQHGPVIIGLARNDRIYKVLVAPYWYIEQEKIELKTGDDVVVRGAKFFSRRGEIFLVARSMNNITTGKIYSFRDEILKPYWRSKRKNRRFNLQ